MNSASKQQQERDLYSHPHVYLTFAFLLIVNMWINFDHGVLPAGGVVIKDQMNLSNAMFGGLGSIVFVGLAFGSIFAVFVFQQANTKFLLCFVLLMNAVALFAFTVSQAYWLQATTRFCTGFFQVFISIYYPVWADKFGHHKKRKTTWMSILLFSSTIGVLIGYVVTSIVI